MDKKGKEQSGSDLISADDAMLVLLPSQNTPEKKARALASFALQCLAEEPALTDETVYLVLDSAIDNLNDLDGVNARQNTLMDEAFYAVIQSRFGQLCHERLLQSYIQACDYRRHKIGGVLTMATESTTLNAENAALILKPLLEKLNAVHSVEERVDAALRLVEAFYRIHGQKSGAKIDFLPNALLHETVSVLLATAQEEASNDAVLTTAIWALGWLTSAKTSDSYTTYTFSEAQLNCLRQIVMTEKRDAFARMWAALALSVCTSEKTVFAQAGWIYEWAVVADGGKPHRQLPAIVPLERPIDIYVLQYLISSHLPMKAKELVAIALGRLGYFIPEMVEPLLDVFQNDLRTTDERDEALVYLVFTGSSQIVSVLVEGANRPRIDDVIQYDLPGRCILALIGIGNVDALKHQLELGMGDQATINAYANALAGVTDPQGRKILDSMKNHQKKQVRDAVINALSQSAQWDSLSKEPIKLSPQNNKKGMFVDQEISKQGHSVHKLKAKDSTGRWAYYFVLIRPESEQKFLKALDSNQSIDLEDYGKVIGSCYGENPSKELRDLLKEKYGFDV